MPLTPEGFEDVSRIPVIGRDVDSDDIGSPHIIVPTPTAGPGLPQRVDCISRFTESNEPRAVAECERYPIGH